MNERKSMNISVIKAPELGRRVRINVSSRKGFSDTEIKRHQSACDLAEIVINSLEFKKKVLAHKFTHTVLNSEEVYNTFIAGKETLSKEVDYEMDVVVEIYEKNNRTVGYTYANTVQTWVNRKFFRQYTLGEIAANLVHEWLHKLGFDHPANPTLTRPSSVPYAIGYMVRDLVADYEKGIRYTDLYPTVIRVDDPSSPTPTKIPVVIPTVEKKRVCYRTWQSLFLKRVCLYQ
jgi:hypothetical protein